MSIKNWFSVSEKVKQFNGVYEPSAVQQLANGHVVILEDEVSRALNLLEFDAQESLLEDAIRDQQLNAQLKQSFDDLEGIALGKNGVIYATTSFSRTSKGKRRPNREKLLRLEFTENGELLKQSVDTQFIKSLKQSGLFKTLDAKSNGKSIKLSDINIEGLSFDADKQKLLFGFKKPLVDDLSLIITMENPEQVLDGTEKPLLSSEVTLLDLHGGGVRSLCYLNRLQGYLIANEVDYGGGPKQSQLWFWKGDEHQPIALTLPDIADMENIEAISAVTVAGKDKIVVMSDDGSRQKKRPAHYSLIDYAEIEVQISH